MYILHILVNSNQKMKRLKYYDHIMILQTQTKDRESSVQVKDTWSVVEDMDFPRLAKLSLPNIEEPEDL